MRTIYREPTQYDDVNATVGHFADELLDALGKNLLGLYIQGSVALGAFDDYSDLDFLVAMHEDVPKKAVADLEEGHHQVYKHGPRPARHLEGSYFPKDILRHEDTPRTPLLYLDNGSQKLERSLHDNDLVTRWITRERGITVTGPPPATLIDPVDPQALKDEVRKKMHTWHADIDTGEWSALPTLWGQSFAVISFCRMLHTVQMGEVYSKTDSVRWALAHLPRQWHELIQQAAADRPAAYANPLQPVMNPAKISRTRDFLRYLLNRDDVRLP